MSNTNFKQQKQFLKLKGETLRLQIALDILENKKSFKTTNIIKQLFISTRGIALVSALLTHRQKGFRVALIFTLANLFLWAKKKLK